MLTEIVLDRLGGAVGSRLAGAIDVDDDRELLEFDGDRLRRISAWARLSATIATTACPDHSTSSSGSGSCGADFIPLK